MDGRGVVQQKNAIGGSSGGDGFVKADSRRQVETRRPQTNTAAPPTDLPTTTMQFNSDHKKPTRLTRLLSCPIRRSGNNPPCGRWFFLWSEQLSKASPFWVVGEIEPQER